MTFFKKLRELQEDMGRVLMTDMFMETSDYVECNGCGCLIKKTTPKFKICVNEGQEYVVELYSCKKCK